MTQSFSDIANLNQNLPCLYSLNFLDLPYIVQISKRQNMNKSPSQEDVIPNISHLVLYILICHSV